jgi:hypothetical protein
LLGARVGGELAGNGGMMAEAKDEFRIEKVSKKTDAMRRSWIRRWETDTGQQRNGGNRVKTNGAERLRIAVDRKLGRNSAKLAEVLTKKALAGDLGCAKVLLALSDAKKPEPPKMGKNFLSLSEWLWMGLRENQESREREKRGETEVED